MQIEYGTITSRILHCPTAEWMDVQNSLVNDEGVCFFRPDFGFLSGLTSWFRRAGIEVDGEPEPDWTQLQREIPENLLAGVTLRDYQIDGIRRALCYRRGLIANSTGAGKSLDFAGIVKLLGGKSVCIFDTTAAAEQMMERLRSYGIENVGMIGGGKKFYDDHIMVVNNSAYIRITKSDPRFVKHLQECQLLAFDEVHHLGGAKTWLQICMYCPAPYRIGLSATPFEDEFGVNDLRLIGAVGPVLNMIKSKELRDRGYLAEPIAFMLPVAGTAVDVLVNNWTHIEKQAIVEHEYRNNLVRTICHYILQDEPQSKILCSVRQQSHGKELCAVLNAIGIRARFSFGGKSLVDEQGRLTRRSYAQVRKEFEGGEFSVLLGSVVYDESQDMPSITDLVLAAGGKKVRRLKQRLGRAERMSPGKFSCRVWDFWDSQHKSTERHSQARLEGFAEEEIFVVTHPKTLNDLVTGRVTPSQAIRMLQGDNHANYNQQDGQVHLPRAV